MDSELDSTPPTSTRYGTAYSQYAKLLPPTATWQHHPRVGDDAGQFIPCPPTENITKDPIRVTMSDEEAIDTTNNCLDGAKESVGLPRPRIPHTSRRRKTRKSQSRIYVRVFEQLGTTLGVTNESCKSTRANCKRETIHWRTNGPSPSPTKVNVARIVGALADDRLEDIIHHFRKKGI